jgi:hypothetical protein
MKMVFLTFMDQSELEQWRCSSNDFNNIFKKYVIFVVVLKKNFVIATEARSAFNIGYHQSLPFPRSHTVCTFIIPTFLRAKFIGLSNHFLHCSVYCLVIT